MPIILKRAYEKATHEDGYRVLVDRLWPRGVSRNEAKFDEWMKEMAPSDQLRKWFHSDPSRWNEFQRRYLLELQNHRDQLCRLAERANSERVTLVFAAKDEEHNNAMVIKHCLNMLVSG